MAVPSTDRKVRGSGQSANGLLVALTVAGGPNWRPNEVVSRGLSLQFRKLPFVASE